jgi:acetyl-CoA carboxylase biotin carboxylase subunit
MIKVSYGHELSIKQEDISIKGHAIECRVCAEDPDNNFLPTPGTVIYAKSPQGPGVRDDSSLFNGYEVTTFYDPMLSKLIVWSENREGAIKRMSRALSEYVVLGVKTNLGFLVRLMNDKDFISGKLDTGFIEKHKKLLKIPKDNSNIATIASAIILHSGIGVDNLKRDPRFTPWKYIARGSSVSRNSMF